MFLSTDLSLSCLLLLLVLLIFVLYPLGQVGVASGVIVEVFFTLFMISGVTSITNRRSRQLGVTVIAISVLLSGWLGLVHPSVVVFVLKSVLTIAFLSTLIVIVLIQVFSAGPITFHRIQGAIAAYLLVAMLWGMFYRLVDVLKPEAFQRGPGAIAEPVLGVLTRECIFLSLATLTTLGYSGIVAVNSMTLSLVMSEALIGQLFPAILLARLVSMEVTSRGGRKKA